MTRNPYPGERWIIVKYTPRRPRRGYKKGVHIDYKPIPGEYKTQWKANQIKRELLRKMYVNGLEKHTLHRFFRVVMKKIECLECGDLVRSSQIDKFYGMCQTCLKDLDTQKRIAYSFPDKFKSMSEIK